MDKLWRLPFAVGSVGDDWPIYNADGHYVAIVFDDDRREVLMPVTPEHRLAARIVAAVNHADALSIALGTALDMLTDLFNHCRADLEPEDIAATADKIDEMNTALAAYAAAKEAQT